MYPLLTFASGLIAGAVGLRLLKSIEAPAKAKAAGRSGVDKAQSAVREATISGLSAIEKTSAHLRTKLTAPAEEPADEPAGDPPAHLAEDTPPSEKAEP